MLEWGQLLRRISLQCLNSQLQAKKTPFTSIVVELVAS